MVSGACKARGSAILARAAQGALIVEVGTLRGDLATCCLYQRPDLHWIMVDSWKPVYQQSEAYRETKDDNALLTIQQAERNRREAYRVATETGANVLRMDSLAAARIIAPGSADLVFIDADHSYEGCAADIDAWRGAVKPGGWLGGHDYRNPDPRFGGVDRAVDERFEAEAWDNYTWWVRL